jgi:hypothetical protein
MCFAQFVFCCKVELTMTEGVAQNKLLILPASCACVCKPVSWQPMQSKRGHKPSRIEQRAASSRMLIPMATRDERVANDGAERGMMQP